VVRYTRLASTSDSSSGRRLLLGIASMTAMTCPAGRGFTQVIAGHCVHHRHHLAGGASHNWARRPWAPMGEARHSVAAPATAAFPPQARSVRSARHESQLPHCFAVVMGVCRHSWSDIL